MSSRALRALAKESPLGKAENRDEVSGESSAEEEEKPRPNAFALLAQDSDDEAQEEEVVQPAPAQTNKANKRKKTKKGKKTKKLEQDDEDIDSILRKMKSEAQESAKEEEQIAVSGDFEGLASAEELKTEAELFKIQHRNLNPNTELRAIFGAALGRLEMERMSGEGGGRRRGGGQQSRGSRGGGGGGRLVEAKADWPPPTGTGLSMISEGKGHFRFAHSKDYQLAQLHFRQAVEMMDHDAFVEILRSKNTYHVDSLLQLAEVSRMQEDEGQARDLVERALHASWSVFHPLFNLTTYSSRLDYRQAENRSFFLALWRHMLGLAKRGCPKTALEFAKLIYSLDPKNDPLGVLLILDYLALKAKAYDYLLEVYTGLEHVRKLSFLPNWAYSVALARFLRDGDCEAATSALRSALLAFPAQLYHLLDKASVEPDSEVAAAKIFGLGEASSEAKGLQLLQSLYAVRTSALWKEAATLAWLESVVRGLLPQLQPEPRQLREGRARRRKSYAQVPLNVQRHVIVSDMAGPVGLASLGLALGHVHSYDPLPPTDSRCEYSLETPAAPAGQNGFFGGLLRSLLPTYEPQLAAAADAAAAAEGGAQGQAMQNQAANVIAALRDVLANVQIQPPEREDQHQPPDPDWD